MMNRVALVVVPLMLLGCKGETAKDATSALVGKTVEVTKGIGSGIGDGIEQGRKNTTSADGSKVLSSPAEVLENVDLAVFEVSAAPNKGVTVVMAVTNKTANPLHLIGLQAKGGALLVDKEGFSTPLLPGAPGQLGEAIVVPPSAKVKANLVFEGEAAKAASVRLWGKDFAVPAAKPADPAAMP
ncbi:MAG: hypothetical protein ACYC8T_38170 [Myxococcaceae bacterium]